MIVKKKITLGQIIFVKFILIFDIHIWLKNLFFDISLDFLQQGL